MGQSPGEDTDHSLTVDKCETQDFPMIELHLSLFISNGDILQSYRDKSIA